MFSATSTLLDDFKQGKFIIIQDNPGRENEADLFIAAEKITPEAVNFMRLYGSGVICVAITPDIAKRLALPLMEKENTSPHAAAFTLSVDAASHVTTGISAADRAYTIKLMAKNTSKPVDFARPGHVFPLRAHPDGLKARQGHTEAACQFASLSGLIPAVALVEIVNPDGSMMRGDALFAFAEQHGIKIGTVTDLIEYQNNTLSENSW